MPGRRNEKSKGVRALLKRLLTGLGSIFNTVSQDTEDTAQSCILFFSWIHFQASLLSEKVSQVSKYTEDTALHVSIS